MMLQIINGHLWILTSGRLLRLYLTQLLSKIRTSFSAEDCTTFQVNLLASQEDAAKLKPLVDKLDEISEEHPIDDVFKQPKKNYHQLLYIAARSGQLNVVEALLKDKRRSPTDTLINGVTPINVACQNGHT